MNLLDLTLKTPAENLALDEAILESAEESGEPLEMLRLWESPHPFVVVGRSSRVEIEVDQDACRQRQIPIFRRCSGGAAIVAGPGCLMYAVVLSYQSRPELRMISEAHCFVMKTILAALGELAPDACFMGTSDLAVKGRKFSGNSLRAKRSHLLYHGTLLYEFPLDLISTCLRTPPRQPDYRSGRTHAEFVTNLGVPPEALRRAITDRWRACPSGYDWPKERTDELVRRRYSRDDWNQRL